MSIDWEVVAAVAFLAFFAWVTWRGGSSNPVGTGQLQKQLNTLGSKVGKLEDAMGGCATTADVQVLRGEIKAMEERAASSGEVLALEGQIAAVNARITGIEKLAERTDAGVQRIEGYFLQRGVNG